MSPTHARYNHYKECSDVARLHIPAIFLIAGKNKSSSHNVPNHFHVFLQQFKTGCVKNITLSSVQHPFSIHRVRTWLHNFLPFHVHVTNGKFALSPVAKKSSSLL